ncbi:MAG: hypothetical protein HY975_03875 [Candidatus Kerfeldbacteria bacterium]|nr:hypothetical protein [Candidatus Kerfeldbacteria bacterium]
MATPLHHHTSHPFVIACTLMSVASFIFVTLAYPVAAATFKTYKHATHGYQFQYLSTWTAVTGKTNVVLKPPAAKIKSLASQGVTHSLNTTWLNNDPAMFTAPVKISLTSGWTKFVPAFSKMLGQKYGAVPIVKTYTKTNWLATVVTLKRKVNGVNTTWRFVVLSRDRKKVFVVGEKWTKNTASPFATDVAVLINSFTTYTPPIVTWSLNGSEWKPSSIPPPCPDPFTIPVLADVTKASSVLYPGQERGGQYKPHGGFRLDGQAYNTVTITAPFDGYVVAGSRHYEGADIQYYFDVIHPCGIRYRLDHLNTLSPTFAALADVLPLPTTSSVSYELKPKLIKAGTVIATAVGHPDNVGFDFGLYDLRKRNAASHDAAYQAAHADMIGNAYYAVCWFDWLSAADEAAVRALPPGDGINGANSDYCD